MALAFSYVSIQVPSAEYTQVTGINDTGEVIGVFQANGADQPHGFLLANGRIVKLDALSGRKSTVPNSLNNRGEIVGTMTGKGVLRDGFIYRNGKFETLLGPAGQATTPRGINDFDVIVGNFPAVQPNGVESLGPSFASADGHFINIDRPGVLATVPAAINDLGVVVGSSTIDGNVFQGYLNSYGTFTSVQASGSVNAEPSAINLFGEIGGTTSQIFEFPSGFILDGGVFTSVSYPGSLPFGEVAGVNDLGQVAGSYAISAQNHGVGQAGFIATPVPSTQP